MMSFVKIFEEKICLEEEIGLDYIDPLIFNIFLDYMKDVYMTDEYYFVCFYEYTKNAYNEKKDDKMFSLDNFDCYMDELNELNPYLIRMDTKKKLNDDIYMTYLRLVIKENINYKELCDGECKRKSVDNITKGECEYINIDELANDKKNICIEEKTESNMFYNKLKFINKKQKVWNTKEKMKLILNNDPIRFKKFYMYYKKITFNLINKKNINYLDLIKVMNRKHYNHFSNIFFSSFVHIMSEIKYDYNKTYNFNILKILDKLNVGLKASFYNNKNILLYYYTFQQYFYLYKFLEDKYYSECVLSEYLLLNIKNNKFIENELYNNDLYRMYYYIKFLYLHNILRHTDLLLNFLIYIYYKYFYYNSHAIDHNFTHFIHLFLSIHEESYNNSLIMIEGNKTKENNIDHTNQKDIFVRNLFMSLDKCNYNKLGNNRKK